MGTCYVLQVSSCSEAAAIDVDVKVSPPSGAVAGAVLFLSGGGSSAYYEQKSSFTYGSNVVQQVVKSG